MCRKQRNSGECHYSREAELVNRSHDSLSTKQCLYGLIFNLFTCKSWSINEQLTSEGSRSRFMTDTRPSLRFKNDWDLSLKQKKIFTIPRINCLIFELTFPSLIFVFFFFIKSVMKWLTSQKLFIITVCDVVLLKHWVT